MSIEESVKALDEIAEGFEKLSEDVCARADLIAMWAGRAKGIRQAIAVIKASLMDKPNDPLTLEELREMEERPVWIERHDGGPSRWAIVGSFDSLYGVYFGTARGGLRLPYDDYGKTWLAYRRRKENDEH